MKTQADFISDIFLTVGKLQTEEDKIDFLRRSKGTALLALLRFAYDDRFTTSYTSIPPYRPDDSPVGLSISGLHREYVRIPFFLNTNQYIKNDAIRNRKLSNILEIIHWTETPILEAIILKTELPYISKELALKAFPDLLGE
jgi:hypothetical protein